MKVYINTFYSKVENSKSPFFLYELAKEITFVDQYNIGLIAKFVSGKSFGIKYGDTDSLYLTCPKKYYEIYNRAFNKKKFFKEKYWIEMINIIMDTIKSYIIK